MGRWQVEFLASCLDVIDDVTIAEGAFSAGPALWVGSREVAHFDQDRTLDLRLTKSCIRIQRQARVLRTTGFAIRIEDVPGSVEVWW